MRFLAVAIAALALTGCSVAKKQAKSDFTGTKAQVAATLATLQSAAKAADQNKICTQVLSAALVKSYGGAKGCPDRVSAILDDVDPTELQMKPVVNKNKPGDQSAITFGPGARPTSATARIQSGSGKHPQIGTVSLVKQGNSWRIDSFG
jgi:hypothetical protein